MIEDKTFMMVKGPSCLGENFGLEMMRITAHEDREIHD